MTDPSPRLGPGARLRLGRWWAVVALFVVVGALALAYVFGFVGAPSAGVVDEGDWGEVTDERTEVITTVWIHNPNPVGASFGDGLRVEYDIALNGVRLAQGRKVGLDVPAGNTTTTLHTSLLNDRLPDWWVRYVEANETVHAAFDATLRADVGPTVTYTVEENRTMMADSRPVIDALSAAADRTTGTYTTSVAVGEPYAEALGLDDSRVTVGYEVRAARARWGAVDRNETHVRLRVRVHNPGDVPVVASPDGLRLAVETNDVTLFESEADALRLGGVGSEELLRPGETRSLTVEMAMDNDRIDEWFTGHVRRGERTNITAELRLFVRNPLTGERIGLPTDGPAAYDCSFRTAILVDNRTAGSDCEPPSGPLTAGDAAPSQSASAPSSPPNPVRQSSSATESGKASVDRSTRIMHEE